MTAMASAPFTPTTTTESSLSRERAAGARLPHEWMPSHACPETRRRVAHRMSSRGPGFYVPTPGSKEIPKKGMNEAMVEPPCRPSSSAAWNIAYDLWFKSCPRRASRAGQN